MAQSDKNKLLKDFKNKTKELRTKSGTSHALARMNIQQAELNQILLEALLDIRDTGTDLNTVVTALTEAIATLNTDLTKELQDLIKEVRGIKDGLPKTP